MAKRKPARKRNPKDVWIVKLEDDPCIPFFARVSVCLNGAPIIGKSKCVRMPHEDARKFKAKLQRR